jgi:hypothetical protein
MLLVGVDREFIGNGSNYANEVEASYWASSLLKYLSRILRESLLPRAPATPIIQLLNIMLCVKYVCKGTGTYGTATPDNDCIPSPHITVLISRDENVLFGNVSRY